MSPKQLSSDPELFDTQTWEELSAALQNLPEVVYLNVWGDTTAGEQEKQAWILCQTLADQFPQIHSRILPRRVNYPYYPVIGILGEKGDEEIDFGVRIIGLPAGYQITSLIAAIQAVAFRGSTLEVSTRIKLHRLNQDINIELMTSAENEGGALMAKTIFGFAVASKHVRSYLIMSDAFPEANLRYSVKLIPHTVINGRTHIEGVVDEDNLVQHIGADIKRD